MEKFILRSALGTAVAAIGLAACGGEPPPNVAVFPPAEPEPISQSQALADEDRRSLVDAIRDRDPFSRAQRLGALLQALGPEGVPAVMQTLEDLTIDLGATDLELLVRYWAIHQPEEATLWALKRSSPLYRLSTVHSAILAWAETDPLGAEAVAQEWVNKDPSLRTLLPIALVRGWYAAGDSPALKQYVRGLGAGFQQQRAIATYVRASMQARDIEEVARWAELLPDDDKAYKLAVYRQVASSLPLFDQAAAMAWCDAHCDGPYGDNLRSMIARRWVLRDGPAALAWLKGAPPGKEADLTMKATFGLWGRTDREPALAWMAAQTGAEMEPWLRPILSIYALFVAEDSPPTAIKWGERITDDKDRETVLMLIAREWRKVDEAAAEAWLLQSPLSEEFREKARRERGGRL